jgi:hypothetical protein
LNEHVRRLASEHGFRVIAQRPRWYGYDPVHIRLGRRREAWHEIVSAWSDDKSLPAARTAWARALSLYFRAPQHRRLWGFEQRGRQPSARYSDGTTVALY